MKPNAQKLQSTPRTDEIVQSHRPYASSVHAETAFDAMSFVARQLERDRQVLVEQLKKARDQFAALSGLAATYPRPSQDPNGRTLLELREMPKACANAITEVLKNVGESS